LAEWLQHLAGNLRVRGSNPAIPSPTFNPAGCSKSIYIKETVCTYVSMSPFHAQTTGLISTKFCADLPGYSGKVLNPSMTLPTRPQIPKPKQITGEKTLLYKKCSDG